MAKTSASTLEIAKLGGCLVLCLFPVLSLSSCYGYTNQPQRSH